MKLPGKNENKHLQRKKSTTAFNCELFLNSKKEKKKKKFCLVICVK